MSNLERYIFIGTLETWEEKKRNNKILGEKSISYGLGKHKLSLQQSAAPGGRDHRGFRSSGFEDYILNPES